MILLGCFLRDGHDESLETRARKSIDYFLRSGRIRITDLVLVPDSQSVGLRLFVTHHGGREPVSLAARLSEHLAVE